MLRPRRGFLSVIVVLACALIGEAQAVVCNDPGVPLRPIQPVLRVGSGLDAVGSKAAVSLTVSDTYGSHYPASVARSILVSRIGSEIRIWVRLVDPCVPDNPTGPFDVDLGMLDPGTYSVSYTSDSWKPWGDPTVLVFAVAESGATKEWPSVLAVEFRHAVLDRHFLTADADEIGKLDRGEIRGWSRTGEAFPVFPARGIPAVYLNGGPVCRLYGLPEKGLDSHFFSFEPGECAMAVGRGTWVWEQEAAFGGRKPQHSGYADQPWYYCDRGMPLFRLYREHNGPDHRYTTSPRLRNELVSAGWVLEGRYPAETGPGFEMCSPD